MGVWACEARVSLVSVALISADIEHTPTPKIFFDGAHARSERAPHLELRCAVRAQESNPGSYRSYLRTRGREIVNA